MRVAHGMYGALVVGIFSGTILIGAAAGAWQTTGGGGGGGGEGRGGGAGSGATVTGGSTSSIKGWMKIGDVATAWNVPLAEILAAFDLPADTDPSTPLKELESELFSVSGLRTWLDARASGSDE